MQSLLSFEQAPPLAAPLRFFLTAPLFAILAALLLLWGGPDLFASRWTPSALALTHLITLGFMLQVMLGATIQILPVMAGANISRPLLIASLVHAATTSGTLLLGAGFLSSQPLAFTLAAGLLGLGTALFLAAAGRALYGVPSANASIRGLQLALPGLSLTVGIGMLLAIARGGSFALPLLPLTSIHLSWGFAGWGLVLLAAVAFVVVPMFQMTPAYPAWFTHRLAWTVLALLGLWTVAESAGWQLPSALLAGAAVLPAAAFAAQTLQLQSRSKRASFDATQHAWRAAMVCTLLACALWLAGLGVPMLAASREWPLLCGVLVMVGGFMSVMIGMLYKIVPFLVWLHLQNLGAGRMLAPRMNKVIEVRQIDRQMQLHFLALALLLAAVMWPAWFAYPAGLALLVANACLLRNLLMAAGFYRQHRRKIAAMAAAPAR